MNKSDRLYKLKNGTETAVWAHNEILKQDKQISKLASALQNIVSSNVLSRVVDANYYSDAIQALKSTHKARKGEL